MKKLLFPLALCASFIAYSQIGIGTPSPQKTLHVNGALQVVKELNVGGNATTAGSAGTAGQVLRSSGPGISPTWTTLEEKEVLLAFFTSNPVTQLANGLSAVSTGSIKQDTNYITANFGGSFTIVKEGYYRILATTNYDIMGSGSGMATSRIQKNGTTTGTTIGIATSTHAAGISKAYHTLAGAAYLVPGDFIYIVINDTLNYKAGNDSAPFVSFTYLGK